ncbi:uncharacterized protein LOC127094099 [Lathyrus oleraceus]|uniref:uncharacterized protein LOC127094099 n=1 Tax=Pisum sativum TaxID=3888 RepID=UPI0021D15D74|nr:uncharacterized protein LOC127094099 [Pisum sativum]
MIDLEDGSSDDQEESLLHHLNPSVAKRMKTRKGKFVAELMSARKAKKTAGLVTEFIVNIIEDISDKNSKEFCKVEITARQVKGWPVKKHLPTGKLNVKYAILHKIGAANWVPTNHISTIANTLGRFIFVVGTKVKFDYGRFMFEQIIKHASTNAVKLPIVFPSMICGIILNQHPGILCSNDLPSRRKPVLSVQYKLFEGSHVEDIVMTYVMKRPASKVGIITELKETCKELGEGIRVATARKLSLEALIASLEQTGGENIEHAKEAEAHTSSERSANNDETSGNSVVGADEVASSSSTE